MPYYDFKHGSGMTDNQDKYIRHLFNKCYGSSIEIDSQLTNIANEILKTPVAHYKDMTRPQASKLIKYLQKEKDGA